VSSEKLVIACDKRKAFARGAHATKQSSAESDVKAGLRSLSSGVHSRDPLANARNDSLIPDANATK